MSNHHFYVVYLSQNDEIVATGNAKECSDQLNTSLNRFYSLVSKNSRGIHKKYNIYIEKKNGSIGSNH